MSFRQLRRSILAANHTPVALEQSRWDMLVGIGIALAKGERVPDDRIAAVCGEDDAPSGLSAAEVRAAALATVELTAGRGGKTAVLSFRGMVTYDVEFQPYAVSTRRFAQVVRGLAADPEIKQIVIVIDSPGGQVRGTPEAADALYEARQTKKVIAVVDGLCASAAYYVASQASEIIVLPSGEGVGSIGVRMTHVDCSEMMAASGIKFTNIFSGKYKTEGDLFTPLSEEALARYQSISDTLYTAFVKTVARGRGVTTAEVLDKYGQGRVLLPGEAKKAGMADRLEAIDTTFARLGLFATSDTRRVEDATPPPAATVEPETPAATERAQPEPETPPARSAAEISAEVERWRHETDI